MEADNNHATETLFEIPAKLEQPRRKFTIVRGESAPPIDDPEAIEAGELRGSEWDPQTFEALDELVAEKAALAAHHRRVAEARLKDAERYEHAIRMLLIKYEHLVPAPVEGKQWKTTTGAVSGGRYRYQPERATKYSFSAKEEAVSAGLTTVYEVTKIDLEAVRAYEREHGTEIPGIERTVPPPVSFNPLK